MGSTRKSLAFREVTCTMLCSEALEAASELTWQQASNLNFTFTHQKQACVHVRVIMRYVCPS